MSVNINRIKEQPAEVWHNDNFIGIVENFLEVNDICLQVRRSNETGVYFIFNGERINILKGGRVEKKPLGFFDKVGIQLRELI